MLIPQPPVDEEPFILAFPLEHHVENLPDTALKQALIGLAQEKDLLANTWTNSPTQAAMIPLLILAYCSPGWEEARVTLTQLQPKLEAWRKAVATFLGINEATLIEDINAEDPIVRNQVVGLLREQFQPRPSKSDIAVLPGQFPKAIDRSTKGPNAAAELFAATDDLINGMEF